MSSSWLQRPSLVDLPVMLCRGFDWQATHTHDVHWAHQPHRCANSEAVPQLVLLASRLLSRRTSVGHHPRAFALPLPLHSPHVL